MTRNDFWMIRSMFQLHALISDGEGGSEAAEDVRAEMELFDTGESVEEMNIISSYCYALAATDPALKKRYRELLFAETTDPVELDAIFQRSGASGHT